MTGHAVADDDRDSLHIDESTGFNLPGVDGEEAAVRSAMTSLRKGQAEGLSNEELGRRHLRLMKAEGAYRAALSRAMLNRYLEVARVDQAAYKEALYKQGLPNEEIDRRWSEFLSKFPADQLRRAEYLRKEADSKSAIRVKTYLEKTPGTSIPWFGENAEGLDTAIKARIETQLRLTRLWESAAFEVTASIDPVICIHLPETITDSPVRGKNLPELFNNRCTSQTIYRLAELGERIAANFPGNVQLSAEEQDAGVRISLSKEMTAIRNRLDLEEYRRLALSGLVVNPDTQVPIGGMLRIKIAEMAEKSLVEYLKQTGQAPGPATKLFFGEPLKDLGESLVLELKKRPEYKILQYLDSGEEPSPKAFFLIVAQVIRAEQEAMQAAYRDGYLGGSFDQVDLEQLLRVSNAAGTGENSIDEVKKRLDRFIEEMDKAHAALLSARELTPRQLEQRKPRHYQLIREMGFIQVRNDDPQSARYVIPESQIGFSAFARRASGGVDMPGKGMLSVVNTRNIAQAILSAALPELAAARFAALGRNLFVSQRAYAAATLSGEMVAGTLLDASMESFFNWRDAKSGEEVKGVEWDRLILESVVLGSALQFTNGAVDQGFDAALKTLGSTTPKTALYQAMKRNPLLAEELQALASNGLGLAAETSLTTFFQMYVQGNMDNTSWQTILVNSALSRAAAKGVELAKKPKLTWQQLKQYVPKKTRAEFETRPRLKAEVLENVNRYLEESRKVLEDFQRRTADETITGKRLFHDLARGDLTWRELTKVIYPAMKGQMQGAMESMGNMRKALFTEMERSAIELASRDVNRFYDLLVMKANNEISSPSEFRHKLNELNAQREWELKTVRAEIITPGSKDLISDRDRSSRSLWVRRQLQALYRTKMRKLGKDATDDFDSRGQISFPTAARAYDNNEYYNVIPFIKESSRYMADMRRFDAADGPGRLKHAQAMEALGMAAVMRFMNPTDRKHYLDNIRAELQVRIDAGETVPVDSGRLERQIEYAMAKVSKVEEDIASERQALAERNPGMPESEVDLLATDAVYERRMMEIRKKEFELDLMSDQSSDQALALRAEILRAMADGLRSGIETYTSIAGIDIIVNRVQQGKKANGEKLTLADRLDDPNFTLEGELSDFSELDIKTMINDQVMFVYEHIHSFGSGHESTYEVGRALGKYVERAFLGMKIMGLDIAEVRNRPVYDPQRRLLEIAQSLAAVKDDPEALLERLKAFSRTTPQTTDAGLAEIFYLVEQVLPGMKNLTGLFSEAPLIKTSPAEKPRRQYAGNYRFWGDVPSLASVKRLQPFSGNSPSPAEAGLTEIFHLVERMLRAMNNLNTVLAGETANQFSSAKEIHKPDIQTRRLRMIARMRWLDALRIYRETLGPGKAVELIVAESANTEAELQWIEKKLAELTRLAEEYRSKDWKRVSQLENVTYEARMLDANLVYPKEPLLGEIDAMKQSAEKALEALRRPLPYTELIEDRLYGEGTYLRLLKRKAFLLLRTNWLSNDLKQERKRAEKSRRLRQFDLTGNWNCESAAYANFTATIEAGEAGWAMEIELPPSLGRSARLDLKPHWGLLKGVWQVTDGGELASAGFVVANTEDGRKLHFTTASTNDPALSLNWSSLTCRIDTKSTTPTPPPFVTVSYQVLPGDEPYPPNWSVSTGEQNELPVKIRRGRKVFYDSFASGPPKKLPPGRYRVTLRLGGSQIVQPLEIKAGMLTRMRLRPAYLRLTGEPERTEFRLHMEGERKQSLGTFRTYDRATVVPGRYDLEILTVVGSTWITGIAIGPGQTFDVKTTTGKLIFQNSAGKNPRIRPALVEGAGEKIWFAVEFGKPSDPLPPGNYDIAWEENGKMHKRQVTLNPGEEKIVDLH